ncbi:MAG TPA: putative quinol monooxygenase [Burkholderiaceae bacterium]|jgi:quinol monooxygenase YgiN|nr:putative quinol monooxygenase [Burkholderiaceae bacterium]
MMQVVGELVPLENLMEYVVVAEFSVVPDAVDRFIEALARHAHNSRTLEEGCITFEVCQDREDATHFLLYEVYRDEQAYQQHRAMPSYTWFIPEVTPMLVNFGGSLFRTRKVLRRISPSSGNSGAERLAC